MLQNNNLILNCSSDENFAGNSETIVCDAYNSRISPTIGYTVSGGFANYSYNPNGICGSVATANLLQYYDDYKSDDFIESNLENDEIGILSMLIKKIEGVDNFVDQTKSSYLQVCNGINAYLEERDIDDYCAEYFYYDAGVVTSSIKKNVPVILLLNGHSKYGNHWVVSYGYTQESGKVCVYYIVDGWGNVAASLTELSTIKCCIRILS